MRAHQRRLFLLTKCLAVIAKVQEAVVSRDNAPGVYLARHKKLRTDKVPHGANKRVGRPDVAVPDELPDGVHELTVPFCVPEPQQVVSLAKKSSTFKWPVRCQRCNKSSEWTGDWSGFSRTVCGATGDPLTMKWEMVTHEPVLGPEGYACARCHLRTERCKSDAFSRVRCPAWALMKPGRGDMVEDVEARPFALQGAYLAVKFKAAVLAEREEILDVPIEEVQAPAAFLGPYRPHKVVVGAQMELCLTCGDLINKEVLRGPAGLICPGRRALPPFARQAMEAGCFDVPILAGGGQLGQLAATQGRVHPTLRRWPLEPD